MAKTVETLLRIEDAALPFVIAAVIGALVLFATGYDPLDVYRLMIAEAFGGESRIASTLTAATPLLLMGLAAAVAFRAGVFNVGAEGCFYLGGLVAALDRLRARRVAVAAHHRLRAPGGRAVGGLWLYGAGVARARLGVDEVVSTLMLNFIAIAVTSWLVDGPLLARGSANSATPPIAPGAELPRFLPPSDVGLGLVISVALVVLYGVWSAAVGFRFPIESRRPLAALQSRGRDRRRARPISA